MYKLTYTVNNKLIETYYLPNIALCKYKQNQLKSTHKL